MACPTDDVLYELASGRLPAAERPELERHLSRCRPCQAALAEGAKMVAEELALSPTPIHAEPHQEELTTPDANPALAAGGGEAARRSLLPPGARVGRYVIEELRGSGGMGRVYLAQDPILGRPVALKVLREELVSSADSEASKLRLLREAQAMARLSHPNVVTVFDAGVHEGRVFIAMEYVEGITLAHWLRQQARDWEVTLGMLRAAGVGLAAAHALGLIHRDFKPANVLVSSDLRVRVSDFGLARALDEPESPAAASGPHLASPLSAGLTRTGVLMGTPAYMAPEQFGGGPVDPRTDQFSFCVTLFEALYGVRPFTGRTGEEIYANLLARRMSAVAKGQIPGWIHQAILRGLHGEPDRRFSSMEDLLAALQAKPERSGPFRTGGRRMVPVAIASLVAAGTAALALAFAFAGPWRGPTAPSSPLPDPVKELAVEAGPAELPPTEAPVDAGGPSAAQVRRTASKAPSAAAPASRKRRSPASSARGDVAAPTGPGSVQKGDNVMVVDPYGFQ